MTMQLAAELWRRGLFAPPAAEMARSSLSATRSGEGSREEGKQVDQHVGVLIEAPTVKLVGITRNAFAPALAFVLERLGRLAIDGAPRRHGAEFEAGVVGEPDADVEAGRNVDDALALIDDGHEGLELIGRMHRRPDDVLGGLSSVASSPAAIKRQVISAGSGELAAFGGLPHK
jgi:hypothetical protein